MSIHVSRPLAGGGSLYRISASVFAALVLLLSLSSCQTITKFKCNTKNWSNVGQKDGASGKVAEKTFRQYYDECSASGAEIDESTYMAGHQKGLTTFCTMENGVAQARDGYENQKLCTVQFGSAFDNGFTQGLVRLCVSSGGQEFGLTGGIYRGTCPSDTEQEFLISYLNAINATLPQSFAEVVILEGKSNTLQSDIGFLEIQISKYDSAIASANESNNNAWKKKLESDRSNISSRLSRMRMEQSRTDGDLSDARKRSQTLQNMLMKWKLRLDV